MPAPLLHDLACVVHLHSTWSDGTGTVPQIVSAGQRAGVDVVSNEVPGLFRQLFVADPNGLRIELQVPLDG